MKSTADKFIEVYGYLCIFFLASRPLSDGDFWWHLKTGEYILNAGKIPKTDLFSFTSFGKPWVTHEWLSEAIFYLIYSNLGFAALIVVFALMTTLAFVIVLNHVQSGALITVPVMVLGVWAILPTIGVRPRVFTLLLASVYLVLLRNQPRARGNRIWWLVPLMVLWVNLHGGFLVGLLLIALTMIGSLVEKFLDGETLDSWWTDQKRLVVVFACCLLAVMLNPHGPSIYLFPFEIFFSPVQQGVIVDWLSPDFHASEAFPLALLILLSIAALGLSPARVKPRELLLFIVLLYATLKSNRHMAIFALIAVPLLAEHLGNWAKSLPSIRRWLFPDIFSDRVMNTILAFGLILPLALMTPKLLSKVYGPPRQESTHVPQNASEFMKANGIVGNTFTYPNIWSGLFIWELPSNPVYIDGRIDMYGDDFVKEYVEVTTGRKDWREAFDRYGVRNAVVSPKSVIARELSRANEWKQVYQDELAVVFIRQ